MTPEELILLIKRPNKKAAAIGGDKYAWIPWIYWKSPPEERVSWNGIHKIPIPTRKKVDNCPILTSFFSEISGLNFL